MLRFPSNISIIKEGCSRVRDVQCPVYGADDVVCQGKRKERDAQCESIAGAGQHDGVMEPKQGPRTEILPDPGVEVQSLPHLYKK